MANKPLSLDEIKNLKQVPQGRPRKKTSTGVDTSDRTATTWFKLFHKYGTCENLSCIDERPINNKEGIRTAMVSEVEGKWMCRICFLAGIEW